MGDTVTAVAVAAGIGGALLPLLVPAWGAVGPAVGHCHPGRRLAGMAYPRPVPEAALVLVIDTATPAVTTAVIEIPAHRGGQPGRMGGRAAAAGPPR